MSPATEPSRVPPNLDVTGLATVEMRLNRLPSLLNSSTTADPWTPLGHPSVVDHVGVELMGPLAGLSTRLPGSVPFAASADAAVSSPAPAVRPTTPRSTSHLTFASRRQSRTI
jgi:hypothetical protein